MHLRVVEKFSTYNICFHGLSGGGLFNTPQTGGLGGGLGRGTTGGLGGLGSGATGGGLFGNRPGGLFGTAGGGLGASSGGGGGLFGQNTQAQTGGLFNTSGLGGATGGGLFQTPASQGKGGHKSDTMVHVVVYLLTYHFNTDDIIKWCL